MFFGQSGHVVPHRNGYGYVDLGSVYFVRNATQNCDLVFPDIHGIPPCSWRMDETLGPEDAE
jgi:hypothetical protein